MGVEHGSALLDRLPGLDYLFDVREPDGFLARLQGLWGGDLDGPLPLPASDRLSAYVPVIGGCNEMCSYCIVPFVRGREGSRPVGAVVEDVERLVGRGVARGDPAGAERRLLPRPGERCRAARR